MGNFRPFIAQSDDEIVRQFRTAEYNNMLGRMAHLYDSDAATTLSVVTSGGTISPNMTDTRYRSGAYSQSTGDNDAVDDGAAEYPQESTTAEPELITGFSYDRVTQTLFSGTVPVQANETWYKAQAIKPVKFENGGFVEMSYQDVLDTYIEDWYDYQEGASPSDPAAAGSYFISTNSSESGATAVSATPVFVDTVADAGSYQSSLIGGSTTTTTTTNFSAVSGTGSQTVLTGIGGSGVSVTVNSVSLSGAGVFHFGDARYSTSNTANTRPAGAVQWYRAGINANGHRTYVFSDDVAYEVYYTAADATRRSTFNSAYLSYGHNKWDENYPTADDVNLIDYTPDPFLYATGSPDHSTGTDVVKFEPGNATHLYIWISGDDGSSNDQNAFVRMEGTNGNSRYFSFNRNSGSSMQTHINALVSDGIISSGTYSTSGGAAFRFVLGGKLKYLNGDFRAGSQPHSGGFAFVEGTTATAQNNTGYYLQTPIGTTRAPLSTWSLGGSNSWTIAAGSYTQTSGTTTYQDHYNTTNYYLHKVDSQKQTQGTGYRTPLIVDYNGSGTAVGLRAMTYAEFDTFFGALINYTTKNASGYRLRYNFDGIYGTTVSSIYNQQMSSATVTGNYQTRFVNINDYRAQEFPNGTIVNQDTWNFKLERY